ncbi:MAG: hypothetical protein ACR2OH_11150, partial [Microthrixaceae bacterium]
MAVAAVAGLALVAGACTNPPPDVPEDPWAPDPVPGPAGTQPPANPFLADSPWPISHQSTYMQASSDLPGPTRNDLTAVDRISGAPGAITMAYGPEYADGSYPVWGSAWFGVHKSVHSDTGIQKVSEVPFIPNLSGGIEDAISTAYSFVDADGKFFAAGQDMIRRYRDAVAGDPTSGIVADGTFEVPAGVLVANDVIVGMSLTHDGTIIIVSKRGVVMAVGRDFTGFSSLALPGGHTVSNATPIDEDGGIYVVSESSLFRIQWTGTALSLEESDGAWSVEYDGGPAVPPPGRLGPGSGTTPTLLGTGSEDKLVAIADGQELMHVNVFWRDEIPADWVGLPGEDRRLAGKAPITFGDPGATRSVTEQSLTGRAHDVMAVSNAYGPPFDTQGGKLAVFASGNPSVQPRGAEKFRWDPATRTLESQWANATISCPNGIPSMSAATGYAYCWGARNGIWTLEGLDWHTGAAVFHRKLTGVSGDNSAYAATEIGPFGAAVSGTLG